MEKLQSRSPDNLLRPEGNDLQSNYSVHDCGEAYLTEQLRNYNLLIEKWGIDARDDTESLIFDNKMDLRLWQARGDYGAPSNWPEHDLADLWNEGDRWYKLKGICDIKTKSNPDWMQIFNLRHLAHYAHWADEYDVPVFLYFTMVDMDAEEVGAENIFVEVPAFENYYDYVMHFDRDDDYSMNVMADITYDCPIVQRCFRAPDGNAVVKIDDEYCHDFDYIVEEVL